MAVLVCSACRVSILNAKDKHNKQIRTQKQNRFYYKVNNCAASNSEDISLSQTRYQVVGLLAGAGSLETAYLTFTHFGQQSAFCPSWSSCQNVLNSSYSEILGIPLSLLGFIAYTTLFGFSVYGATNSNAIERRWNFVQQGVVGSSVLLLACCAVLSYILIDRIGDPRCLWCLLSIALSSGIGVTVWSGLDSRQMREAIIPCAGLASSVVLTMSFWLSWVETSQAKGEIDIPYNQKPVMTESSPMGIELAKKLTKNGAKMYGAFWCSHCFEQKEMFGQQALEYLPYVECYPNGYRKGVKMTQECLDVNLEGFPTWVINGKQYEGEQTMIELEEALQAEDAEQVETVDGTQSLESGQ